MLDAECRMPSFQVKSKKGTWKDAIQEGDAQVFVNWFPKNLLSLEGENSHLFSSLNFCL